MRLEEMEKCTLNLLTNLNVAVVIPVPGKNEPVNQEQRAQVDEPAEGDLDSDNAARTDSVKKHGFY